MVSIKISIMMQLCVIMASLKFYTNCTQIKMCIDPIQHQAQQSVQVNNKASIPLLAFILKDEYLTR